MQGFIGKQKKPSQTEQERKWGEVKREQTGAVHLLLATKTARLDPKRISCILSFLNVDKLSPKETQAVGKKTARHLILRWRKHIPVCQDTQTDLINAIYVLRRGTTMYSYEEEMHKLEELNYVLCDYDHQIDHIVCKVNVLMLPG